MDESNSSGADTSKSTPAATEPDGALRASPPSCCAVAPAGTISDEEDPRRPRSAEKMSDHERTGGAAATTDPDPGGDSPLASRSPSPTTTGDDGYGGPVVVPRSMAVFVRILFKYLERVDVATLALARKVSRRFVYMGLAA